MKHRIILLYSWFVRLLLIWAPDQPVIMRSRGYLYGLAMAGCGSDFQVSSSVVLRSLENMSVGNSVHLAPGVIVNAIGSVKVGNEVLFGFNTVVVSGNHVQKKGSYRFGESSKGLIEVGSGSWIAANCSVLSGAKMGECTVLAANSALSTEIPDFTVHGGVPARFIKKLQFVT